MTPHRAFYGDGERDFVLTAPLIIELERRTNAGIGSLAKRVFSSDFRHADIVETIRLALIGGGTDPEEAAALVATYTASTPIAKSYSLAVQILEATWFGSATDVGDVLAAENAMMEEALRS